MTRSIAVARLYFPDGHCEKRRLIRLDSQDNVVGIEALTHETAFTLWHRGEAHLLPEGKLQLTPSLHNGRSHLIETVLSQAQMVRDGFLLKEKRSINLRSS